MGLPLVTQVFRIEVQLKPKLSMFCKLSQIYQYLKGLYADHILIPQGSTGSSAFFDIK